MTPGSQTNILVTFSGTQIPVDLPVIIPQIANVGLVLNEVPQNPGPNEIQLSLTATAAVQALQNYPISIWTNDTQGNSSLAILSVSVSSGFPAITGLNRSTVSTVNAHISDAVYDPVRKLVFATVNQLNEVVVLSSVDGTLKATIPAPLPKGIDETADGSAVYVGSFGRNLIVINSDTLQVTQTIPAVWETNPDCGPTQLAIMSNAQVVLVDQCLDGSYLSSGTNLFLWNPATNAFLQQSFPLLRTVDRLVRSADRSAAIAGANGSANLISYNASAGSFSLLQSSDSNTNMDLAAIGPDGSQIAAPSSDTSSAQIYSSHMNFYNSQLQLLSSTLDGVEASDLIYSLDGHSLYAVSGGAEGASLVSVFDTSTFALSGLVPNPVGGQPYGVLPYAIDETGMIFADFGEGLALIDASHPGAIHLPVPEWRGAVAPQILSLTGPTPVVLNSIFTDISDSYQAYFGAAPASPQAQSGSNPVLESDGLHVTAPPGAAAGPANVTLVRSDGWLAIAPNDVTYGGPQVELINDNAGPAQGGSQIEILGYAVNEPGVQVTIGGSPAPLYTTNVGGPSNDVGVTVPPGTPGPADVTITTPSGSTTVPGGFHYLSSAAVFPVTGTLSQIIYDQGRQRLYVSNTDHNRIEVFSLASQAFLTPIAVGSKPMGMALTPDGSLLAAANSGDGTVSVINPDSAQIVSTYSVLPAAESNSSCAGQPMSIAAEGTHGMLVAVLCATGDPGSIHSLDLTTGALGTLPITGGAASMASSPDGSTVAMAGLAPSHEGDMAIFNSSTGSISYGGQGSLGIAIDADANRVAAGDKVYDQQLSLIALPQDDNRLGVGPENNHFVGGGKLNSSGSLLFIPESTISSSPTSGMVIFDIHRGRLVLRIALPDALPRFTFDGMALDETGTKIFLISSTGITVAQLASAPLSIGTVTPSSAGVGTQVAIRGSGFTAGSAITIGGVAAATTYVDAETLQAVVPSVPSGPVQIVVTNSPQSQYSYDDALVVQ